MPNLKDLIKEQIDYLKSLDKNKSVEIKVGEQEFPMYVDVEILIKEKESELENAQMYIDEIVQVRAEMEQQIKKLNYLNSLTDSTITLYLDGIPFDFQRDKVIESLKKEMAINEKNLKELLVYTEIGKQIY